MYPNSVKERKTIDLKLRIKSSLPKGLQMIALLYLLWKSNDKKSEIIYGEEINTVGNISLKLKDELFVKLKEYLRQQDIICSENFEEIVNANPLLTLQYEPLLVGLELVWKLCKIEFVDQQKSSQVERTGGNRYSKILKYTKNIEIIYHFLKDIDDLDKIFYEFLIDNRANLNKENEKHLKISYALTFITEDAKYLIVDEESNEIIFENIGIYEQLLQGNNVKINSSTEVKGSTRILYSLLDQNMNVYLEYNKSEKLIKLSSVSDTEILNFSDYYDLIENYKEITNDIKIIFINSKEDTQNEVKKIELQKIVYGAPGTGKSYSLNQEAKEIFKREILLEKSSDEIPTKKYWVVTCGERNWAFEEFKRQGIYSIGWEGIKNISKLTYAQLEKEAIEKYNNKFGATQLNNIAHEMKIGDILLVRKGVKNKEIVGYGVISQEQYEEEIKDNTGKKLSDFYHNIKVDWKKFSPTKLEGYPKYFQRITTYKANPELIKEFEKVCPQETPSKFDTKEVSTVERVTFYDGYTYGQFVGMYKPVTLDNGDISYEYIPGPFMKQLVLAYKNSKDKFCLLIEEINRAKADKVFGNIFQLLDRNSQGESEYPISVSKEQYKYLKENLDEEEDILERIENEGLYLPNNLYIWATMNSADDGVQPLDTAFKRRWKFNYISLNANEKAFGNEKEFIIGKYKGEFVFWNKFRKALNTKLKDRITEDRLIAPFFISPNDFDENSELEKKVLNQDIFIEKVLMYIFDDLLRHYPKKREQIFKNGISTFSDIVDKNKVNSEEEIQKGIKEEENFLEKVFLEDFIKEAFIKEEKLGVQNEGENSSN